MDSFLPVCLTSGWVWRDRAGWSQAVRHAGAGGGTRTQELGYHPLINIHRRGALCVSACVFMCVSVQSLYVQTPPGVSQFLLVSSFLAGSVTLSSLRVVLLTPLHFEVPEGLASHHGSGGFCPSLSPEDASTSCSPGGRRVPEAERPSRVWGHSCPLGLQLRSSVPKLARKSGRLCWGWGGPPAAWSPGTKASDWSWGTRLHCEGLTSLGHQMAD